MSYAAAPELSSDAGRKLTIAFFVIGSAFFLLWPLVDRASFTGAMRHGWWGRYAMGFGKFLMIGMLGEMFKKKWHADRIPIRALVWGGYGAWITLAFVGFNLMVESGIRAGLAPSLQHLLPQNLQWINDGFVALQKSLWINVIGGFAWTMMLSHDYVNNMIATNGQQLGTGAWAKKANALFLLGFLPKTIWFFWLPVHTFTFSLPKDYQPLMAAFLAFMLGVFQSWGKKQPVARPVPAGA